MSKKLQHIEESVDRETGEIRTTKKTFSVRSKTKYEFFMMFTDVKSPLFDLKRSTDIKVLLALCAVVSYNTNNIVLSPRIRREMLDLLNISPQAFTNSLQRLKEKKLISGERGDYLLNPLYTWKGTTDGRESKLKEIGEFNLKNTENDSTSSVK